MIIRIENDISSHFLSKKKKKRLLLTENDIIVCSGSGHDQSRLSLRTSHDQDQKPFSVDKWPSTEKDKKGWILLLDSYCTNAI